MMQNRAVGFFYSKHNTRISWDQITEEASATALGVDPIQGLSDRHSQQNES